MAFTHDWDAILTKVSKLKLPTRNFYGNIKKNREIASDSSQSETNFTQTNIPQNLQDNKIGYIN